MRADEPQTPVRSGCKKYGPFSKNLDHDHDSYKKESGLSRHSICPERFERTAATYGVPSGPLSRWVRNHLIILIVSVVNIIVAWSWTVGVCDLGGGVWGLGFGIWCAGFGV